jgi:hypothetical protein
MNPILQRVLAEFVDDVSPLPEAASHFDTSAKPMIRMASIAARHSQTGATTLVFSRREDVLQTKEARVVLATLASLSPRDCQLMIAM